VSDVPTFDPLQTRRDEVAQYSANIVMFQAILQTLPTEWPEHLAQHKGAKDQHAAIDAVPETDVELVSQLWYADQLRHLIRTETVERTKAAAILAVLEAQA